MGAGEKRGGEKGRREDARPAHPEELWCTSLPLSPSMWGMLGPHRSMSRMPTCRWQTPPPPPPTHTHTHTGQVGGVEGRGGDSVVVGRWIGDD